MKKEVIHIIKVVGLNLNELILDIKVGNVTFNTIEYVEPDKVIIHTFYQDYDIEIEWEYLTNYQKSKILRIIKPYLYN